MGLQLRDRAVGLDERLIEEQRVRARVPDALDARHVSQGVKQFGKGHRALLGGLPPAHVVAAVGVDRLAQQGQLAHARVGELPRLGEDALGRPADLASAGRRHDAESAEHVAAFHDREKGAPAPALEPCVGCGQVEAVDVAGLAGVGGPLALPGGGGHRRHVAHVVRAEHEVEMAEAGQQPVAHLLRHAAADAQRAAGPRGAPIAQLAEVAVQLVLGLVADRAGVDDQQVGVGFIARRTQPGVVKEILDLLRVVDVHLAPVGADRVVAGVGQGRRSNCGVGEPGATGGAASGAAERTRPPRGGQIDPRLATPAGNLRKRTNMVAYCCGFPRFFSGSEMLRKSNPD